MRFCGRKKTIKSELDSKNVLESNDIYTVHKSNKDDNSSYILAEYVVKKEEEYFPQEFGDKPGKYSIDLVCTKSTLFSGPITISFDMYNETTGDKIGTLKKTVELNVKPAGINYLACLNKKGEDVQVLDQANADNAYQFTIIGYDKYSNVVNEATTAIGYTLTPPSGKVGTTISKNTE